MIFENTEIHILQERCKECNICIDICQVGVLELSKEVNANNYHFPVAKNPNDCINCGLCEMLCPEFAIWVTSDKEDKNSVSN